MITATAVSRGPFSRTREQKEQEKGPWSRTRMREEGDNKSVLHCAVFVEPFASDDDGGDKCGGRCRRLPLRSS